MLHENFYCGDKSKRCIYKDEGKVIDNLCQKIFPQRYSNKTSEWIKMDWFLIIFFWSRAILFLQILELQRTFDKNFQSDGDVSQLIHSNFKCQGIILALKISHVYKYKKSMQWIDISLNDVPVIESKYELDDICLEIHHTVKIMAFKHLTSFAVFPTSSFIILLQDFMGNEYSQRIQLLFKIYAA